MNNVQVDALREFISENLFVGSGTFMVVSINVKDKEDAQAIAATLGGKIDDSGIKVSRMGVYAVELSCEGAANVVLAWQGDRPDKADDEADEEAASTE